MVAKTFSAEVVSGQLRYQESLNAFEGQAVEVTVVAQARLGSRSAPLTDSGGAEPPDWMAVETNLFVKMPFSSEVLQDADVVEGEPIRPCIILPEESTDE